MNPLQMSLKLTLLEILTLFGVCQCYWTSGGICDQCLNEPLIVFNDKKVTEGVVWTVQGMTSRAECASRCHLFEKIKSFGFSSATGECVAYTVPLATPASVTHTSQSGFQMYSTCAPVDGGFSAWGLWSGSCPNTCGEAPSVARQRTRTCSNPSPDNGGADCSGSTTDTDTLSCSLGNCPIDGGFSAWGSWSGSCPNTCGEAPSVTRQRTRTCSNPSPAYGGADCSGSTRDTDTFSCSLGNCPINGGFSAWGSWSTSCPNTCGTASSVNRQRTRTCSNPYPAYGGADCSGSTTETDTLSCSLGSCPMAMPNFGSCSSNPDCTSPSNTVCEQGMCVCDIMYQYKSGSCIQGCSSYSTEFTLFHGKVLNGYNDKIVSSITTVEACLDLCVSESSFACVTADYEHSTNTCYLSKTTWFGAPSGRSTSTTYHQLIRNCAS